jgi:hypothetical protein
MWTHDTFLTKKCGDIAVLFFFFAIKLHSKNKKITPWPESLNELYRPSYRCLSVKLVPTFADEGYHVA